MELADSAVQERATPVGLIGLGLMGTAMSTRLLAAGFDVDGFDVSERAREAHRERGGTVSASPREMGGRCRVILLSLPNGDASRAVCSGPDGLRHTAGADAIVVETSTIDPDDVEDIADELANDGVTYVDAALSGSSDMVARGDTLAMVGGDRAAFTAIRPVLDTFCREARHVGAPGAGMRAKLVVNLVLALNRFALAEGLVLAEKMGVDLDQMLAVLKSSAARSTAMDMWGERMVERRYSAPVSRIRMHNKDARLTLDVSRRHGAPIVATTQLNTFVQAALANGLGELDNSVIIEVLRTMAGVGPGLGALRQSVDADDA